MLVLGFSIAGGTDTPCINNSSAVVVTRITEGGLADRDQSIKVRLFVYSIYFYSFLFYIRLHDIILRVNDMDFTTN